MTDTTSVTHKVFVYGTLRPGLNQGVHYVPGVMFDLGWFPGVTLDPDTPDARFVVETIEVDDAGLSRLDSYEGYHEEAPDSSLYLRKSVCVDGVTAWIYEYNQGFSDNHERVLTGDWLAHTNEQSGASAGLAR